MCLSAVARGEYECALACSTLLRLRSQVIAEVKRLRTGFRDDGMVWLVVVTGFHALVSRWTRRQDKPQSAITLDRQTSPGIYSMLEESP